MMENHNVIINALSSLLNYEISYMTAENQHKLAIGEGVAYGEEEFAKSQVARELQAYMDRYPELYKQAKEDNDARRADSRRRKGNQL